MAFTLKFGHMFEQQLDDVFLDAVTSAQGGGSLQFVYEIGGDIS